LDYSVDYIHFFLQTYWHIHNIEKKKKYMKNLFMIFTSISSVLRQYYCFKISVINKRLLGVLEKVL